MREAWFLVAVMGCSSNVDGDTWSTTPFALTGQCDSLGSDGAIEVPVPVPVPPMMSPNLGTVLAYPFRVVNTTTVTFYTPELRWTVEGPDAADFALPPTESPFIGPADYDGCDFDFIQFSTHIERVLAPGESCRKDVVFTPTSIGEKRATFHVQTSPNIPPPAPGRQGAIDQRFEVRATAVAPPALWVPPEIYVGIARPYADHTAITNTSANAIDIGDVVATGSIQVSSGCPTSLSPGDSCYLLVKVDGPVGCELGQVTTTTAAFTVVVHGIDQMDSP